MAHITTIISKRQVSDDAIAVTIRCCANAKTDSTVTIYGASTKTPAQINARIDKHHDHLWRVKDDASRDQCTHQRASRPSDEEVRWHELG